MIARICGECGRGFDGQTWIVPSGTCGNCAHANDEDVAAHDNLTICTKFGHFYAGKVMQKTAHCEAWEAKP